MSLILASRDEGMADIDEWRRYAKMLGFPRALQAEKDYLQDILLREIYAVTGNELLFRGGTAISKLYGSGRFSEDLDFILNKDSDEGAKKTAERIERAITGMNSYFDTSYEREEYREMVGYTITVYGPLHKASGSESAKQRISIDFNTYERNMIPAMVLARQAPYQDLPPYTIIAESEEELIADKVKAAIERRRKHRATFARDVYDIWLLAAKYGIKPDFDMVAKKMELYGTVKFSMKDFRACIKEAEGVWNAEMGRVAIVVPDYGDVKKVLDSFTARG